MVINEKGPDVVSGLGRHTGKNFGEIDGAEDAPKGRAFLEGAVLRGYNRELRGFPNTCSKRWFELGKVRQSTDSNALPCVRIELLEASFDSYSTAGTNHRPQIPGLPGG